MPFLVAHRAGNDLARLREAEELGVALVEADVRLWRGRAEVRHLKTLGPIPILWDRWALANPFAPRLQLADLLAAVGPATELMLDLKGRDLRLARLVRAALPPDARVAVCARSPRLLSVFEGDPHVRVVHSVGSARQLRALLHAHDRPRCDGVSIHERLLDAATVRALRERAATVMTWPVKTAARARELVELGVDGLITEDLTLAHAIES